MEREEGLEHLKNLSIAAVSAIPVWGGPISVLLDKYLPSYVERRRTEMLANLSNDLQNLSARITPERLSSDEFISVFIRAFRRAMEEHLSEKLEAFRAIIVNSALSPSAEFDEITLFIRLVGELTADQIRILRLLQDNRLKDADSGLFQAVQQVWPDVDGDYLLACVTELLRYNLASSNPKDPERQGRHFLTGLGERFVEYISLPRNLQSETSQSSEAFQSQDGIAPNL